MVKIKDFTLASKNLGGRAPRAIQNSRPCEPHKIISFYSIFYYTRMILITRLILPLLVYFQ